MAEVAGFEPVSVGIEPVHAADMPQKRDAVAEAVPPVGSAVGDRLKKMPTRE